MYENLDQLKQGFYSDQNMSSKELLQFMENVVLGTNDIETLLNFRKNKKEIRINDDLYRDVAFKFYRSPIENKYPSLSGKIDIVDYSTNTPQEWDIAFHENANGIRHPALYVYLDGQFKRRCDVGDDIVVIYGKDVELANRGYRLKNV